MVQLCSVSNSLSHTTFQIKWEAYFSKNCVARLYCVVVMILHAYEYATHSHNNYFSLKYSSYLTPHKNCCGFINLITLAKKERKTVLHWYWRQKVVWSNHQVKNLNEAVCISNSANNLRKCTHPTIPSPAKGKQKYRLGSLTLVWQQI